MATGDFKSFLSSMKTHGLARTNRYNVVFTPPETVMASLNMSSSQVDVFCNTVSMPGVTYSTVPDKVYGDTIEMPMSKSYGDLKLELFVDSNFRIRYMFEQWLGMIESPLTRNFGYYEDYARPVVINTLNMSGDATYSINIQEAYPVSMSEVQLSQAPTNTPYLLSVTMNYRYFTTTPIALLVSGTSQAGHIQ